MRSPSISVARSVRWAANFPGVGKMIRRYSRRPSQGGAFQCDPANLVQVAGSAFTAPSHPPTGAG